MNIEMLLSYAGPVFMTLVTFMMAGFTVFGAKKSIPLFISKRVNSSNIKNGSSYFTGTLKNKSNEFVTPFQNKKCAYYKTILFSKGKETSREFKVEKFHDQCFLKDNAGEVRLMFSRLDLIYNTPTVKTPILFENVPTYFQDQLISSGYCEKEVLSFSEVYLEEGEKLSIIGRIIKKGKSTTYPESERVILTNERRYKLIIEDIKELSIIFGFTIFMFLISLIGYYEAMS
mgnify:CR=1 FL=1